MSEPLRDDPDAVCEQCGGLGAFRFETETLCGDCYAERGACCACDSECEPDESSIIAKDIPRDPPDAPTDTI